MRLFYFDLLRCIAIVFLLTAHIAQSVRSPLGSFFGIPGFYHVSIGGVAVTIFLIISGAVLEFNYGKTKLNYSQFVFKRILRIYPVYYLALILGICVFMLRSWSETGHIFANFEKLGFSDLILSITAGYAYAGRWGGPFVETSWFVVLIMTMYLCFPYLSKRIKEKPLCYFIVLLFVSVASRLMLGKYNILPTRPLDWFPLCRLFEFSFGIYIAIYLSNKNYNEAIRSNLITKSISFLSVLSFPLFLFHLPLKFLIKYLSQHGWNLALAVVFYLVVSITLSWVALELDNRIPRESITNRFDEIIA